MNDQLPPAPKRRVQLSLALGADSYEGLLIGLENFLSLMRSEGEPYDRIHRGTLGEPNIGWAYVIETDPEQTHDRYFEQVKAWFKENDIT